jgi:hypothetical protein
MAKYNMVQMVWDRESVSPDEDVAVMTMHIRQVVAGAPDLLPVTDEGRTDFASRCANWLGEVQTYISSQYLCRELRFYDIPDGGPFLPKDPRGYMGDPVKIAPMNARGLSPAFQVPAQIAVSVTFKTAHRKRWGRFYIPGFTVNSLTGNARLSPGVCDALANSTHHLTSRSGTGAALTVFSRKYWNHEDPETIQVDDVLDVIRRRRLSNTTHRGTAAAG